MSYIKSWFKWFKYIFIDLKKSHSSDPNITYLVSFPKTGVTWLKLMLTQILIKTYNLDCGLTVDLNKISLENSQLPKILWTHDDSNIIDETGKMKDVDKIFIYGGCLRYRKNRVILLVRDPRDVVVSHYYQVTQRSDKALEFDSISEFIRHQQYGIHRIIRFYQIWSKNQRVPKDLLIVRYEDMLTDGPAILTKILNFINLKNFDINTLNQVYEDSQADKMRKLELRYKSKVADQLLSLYKP